jgi:sulfate transport system substrate-binding protein
MFKVGAILGKFQLKLRHFLGLWLVGLWLGFITSCTPLVSDQSVSLTLVSFAATKAAYDRIIPQFVAKWQKEHQQTVRIFQSYGGSAAQARAVIDGLEADIVHLALSLDVNKLEEANLVDRDWTQELPHESIVTRSVPVIVPRQGNPKNIHTWSDLAREGVTMITADPKTSGVARWNFLALWNFAIQINGGDETQAKEFVKKIYTHNVSLLSRDAREATDAFYKQNQGDALVNYEHEIILAQIRGQSNSYIVPDINISIENPVTIVDTYARKHNVTEIAKAFVEYLYSPEAQREFSAVGFRPVDSTILKETEDKLPPIIKLSSVKDFGGWQTVQDKFFGDGAIFDQIRTSAKS